MSILTQTVKENLTHHQWLGELKLFLESLGSWVIVDYLTSTQWKTTSPFGFIAGSESFLEITNVGYGSQAMRYRFRAQQAGTAQEWIELSGNTAVRALNSTLPCDQNQWNSNQHISFKPSAIEKAWFFGNTKFVVCFIKFSSDFVQCVTFGSLELYDTAKTDCYMVGYVGTSTATTMHWSDASKSLQLPFDLRDTCFFWESGGLSIANMAQNIQFNTASADAGQFYKLGLAVKRNAYSNQRSLFKTKYMFKRTSDGLFEPVGELPLYRADVTNLAIGEEISIGSKKFICFPALYLERTKGVAVRVA